jgi:hypothetical protein
LNEYSVAQNNVQKQMFVLEVDTVRGNLFVEQFFFLVTKQKMLKAHSSWIFTFGILWKYCLYFKLWIIVALLLSFL